ncbi:hypothetical protein DQ239_08760 [Blastococcus sp. TF02-09]|uniref:hypothetical protein n=1 Tax=Blastococcus sp. TF02-09 TaxID=2250576 RepID=UPI000DE99E8B|nr:hypothetical protein [Blastococcus sp. TF02-9]RBY78616.1 hypothetical protein DQ239_08760 [Blastococcus sp. TF02-9]
MIIEPFGWSGDVKLRVPPEHSAEIRRLLDEAGLAHSQGMEHSHGPVMDLLVATVEEPAAWAALAGVVTTYLRRNVSRSVRVGDTVVKGYAAQDAERIVRELGLKHRDGGNGSTAGPDQT